jgi:hypothetical protein
MAMIENIDDPSGLASVRWLSPAEGGRRSGPPTAPVYSATAVFKLGDDEEVLPGWPATGDHISILVQRSKALPDGTELATIGFLAPDLARPFVHTGSEFVIMEGPRAVGHGTFREIFE